MNTEHQLLSFFNDKKVKTKYVKRIHCHKIADELIHGTYWENGKGCAIGCILHSAEHEQFETELGLPVWLAYLVDYLFEQLPNGKSKEFPELVLKSIKVGVNLDKTYHKFCIFLLKEVCKNTDHPLVKNAIDQVVEYHTNILTFRKDDPSAESAWSAAESAAQSAARSAAGSAAGSAAWSARSAARSAAQSAARSAAGSAAGSAAESAAWSAAWSARSAAQSAARSAAGSAWSAGSAAGSAWSAGSAARSAAWSARSAGSAANQKIADKLILLLKEAN